MRFNTNIQTNNKTVNNAGGEAYKQSSELELVSLVLTSFLKDTYYTSGTSQLNRLIDLIDKADPLFVAKLAVYARREFGMRSVTHVIAGVLASKQSKQNWMKDFLNSVIYRADDITEITSFYMSLQPNQKITNSMRKGLGKALTRFNEYQLAKYKGAGKSISLVDCVNLFHPKSNEALTKLVKGTLTPADTWEVGLSEAGKSEDVEFAKKEVWTKLITDKKIGYFALLRNLRNILSQAPELVPQVCEILKDEKLITNNLIFPFRYLTALEHVGNNRDLINALSVAIDISLNNVPELPGNTLIALDTSGSMTCCIQKAALFASVLYKKLQSDLICFDTSVKQPVLDMNSSVLGIYNQLQACPGGGTDFRLIFQTNSKFDRIIILSDMEAWVGGGIGNGYYNDYCKRIGSRPELYCFDLTGNGTMQFPESNVYSIAGFSEKIFDFMKNAEGDKNVMINTIKNYSFLEN